MTRTQKSLTAAAVLTAGGLFWFASPDAVAPPMFTYLVSAPDHHLEASTDLTNWEHIVWPPPPAVIYSDNIAGYDKRPGGQTFFRGTNVAITRQ